MSWPSSGITDGASLEAAAWRELADHRRRARRADAPPAAPLGGVIRSFSSPPTSMSRSAAEYRLLGFAGYDQGPPGSRGGSMARRLRGQGGRVLAPTGGPALALLGGRLRGARLRSALPWRCLPWRCLPWRCSPWPWRSLQRLPSWRCPSQCSPWSWRPSPCSPWPWRPWCCSPCALRPWSAARPQSRPLRRPRSPRRFGRARCAPVPREPCRPRSGRPWPWSRARPRCAPWPAWWPAPC